LTLLGHRARKAPAADLVPEPPGEPLPMKASAGLKPLPIQPHPAQTPARNESASRI